MTILGSNIISPEDYFFQDYYLEEKIIEVEGLKLGVFGLIGEDAGDIAPDPGRLMAPTFFRPGPI